MAERKETKLIVVHCAATTPAMTHVDIEWIRKVHMQQNGWSRVGYHKFIKRDGVVQDGCPLLEPGIHVAGHNSKSVAVCLAGGLNRQGKIENNFTEEQFEALLNLLQELKQKWPAAHILGHRDLSPDKDGDGIIEAHEWLKGCPCFDVREWLGKEAPELL